MSTIQLYGEFIEEEKCFMLTKEPPKKWVNLHYNKIGDDEVYAEISNIGDGSVWVRDKEGNTCTLVSYDNKYVYIRDEESGTVFSPAGSPAPQHVENYCCRYYAAKTEISSSCEGINVKERVFVPKDYTAEVWTVTLVNTTDRTRKVSVFAYAIFQLTGCDKEGRYVGKDNYAVVHPEIGGVFITNRNAFVPTDRYKGYLVT